MFKSKGLNATPAFLIFNPSNSSAEQFKIACCQLGSEIVQKTENWNANLEKAITYIEEAAKQKADLVVFPEMYLANYMAQDESRYFAEPIPGPTTLKLSEEAQKHNIYIIIGMPVMAKDFPGLVKNSAAVIGPGVKICEGAVIGAMSLVKQDCEKPGLYAGIPARIKLK